MIETRFRPALLDANIPTPQGLICPTGNPADKRFDVYRNNVAIALTEALKTGFPVLEKLIGPENFTNLARVFLREHPPRSPIMMHYGTDMPAFLEGFEPLADIAYLPDVARLELAMRRSYHAADEAKANDLTALDENSRVRLAPSLEYLPSQWPVWDIWNFNTTPGAPHPQAFAQHVLILRQEFDPVPHPISPAEGALIESLLAGECVGVAMDQATAVSTEFDLARTLGILIHNNAITGIQT